MLENCQVFENEQFIMTSVSVHSLIECHLITHKLGGQAFRSVALNALQFEDVVSSLNAEWLEQTHFGVVEVHDGSHSLLLLPHEVAELHDLVLQAMVFKDSCEVPAPSRAPGKEF
jgi:hypothetical protein